ncbi:dual specificity protein phosphatase [Novymonas esmeraldas]|uniref:Dual specificity protein phosphatase n=1 Tax=Novymonas esmeraldas TaxID=1808958 RepID=A0AAW0EX93_9TRYP
MPPKASQSATPPPPPSDVLFHHLPDADLNLFFRILRFVSAHQQLSDLNKAVDFADGGTGAPSSSPTVSAPSSAVPRHRTQTGTSTSVSNRIRTPPSLREPLEAFRMMATNLPIDQEGLDTSRAVLCELLEELCEELADPDIIAELHEKVLPSGEGAPAEESGDEGLGSSAVECGVIRRPSGFGVDGLSQMQEVIPGLWCGSYHPATDRELMQRHGITHVCCCIGTQPRFPGDFMYMTLAADDRPDYEMSQHFARTFEFIENALVKCHGGVLVHCGAGISRAPTVVSAYLMRKVRLGSSAAVHLVQHHRACASPNMGFRRQLHAYGKQIGVEEAASEARGEMDNKSFARAMNSLKK